MKKLLTIVLFLGIGVTCKQVYCQEAITSTSGIATGSGGSLSFSVGLIVHKELSGTGGSMSQGIQVPRELLNITEEVSLTNSISVYPNPVENKLTFDFGNHITWQLHCSVVSLTGETVKSASIDFNNNTINMEELKSGIYFLRITNEKQEIQTIKIIKL